MPKRIITGGVRRSLAEMAAILNMTVGEMMVLVKNGIPHTDMGNGHIMFTEHEVLAHVKPLPKREFPLTEVPKAVVEDEEEEPVETVRPEPRPVPSMTSTKPPVLPAVAKKPAAKKKK